MLSLGEMEKSKNIIISFIHWNENHWRIIHLRLNVEKAMLSLRWLLVLAKFHVSVASNRNYWKSLNSNRRYSNRFRNQLHRNYCKVTIGLLQNR